MAADKIYPKGLRFFKKHDKAPDFVLGTLVINPNELFKWLKENPQYLNEYKDEKQLKLQLLSGKDGVYATVDTYKKSTEPSAPAQIDDSVDNLPF